MKKQKTTFKKLTLNKKSISKLDDIQGGAIPETKFIVICHGTIIVNTTILNTIAGSICNFTNNPDVCHITNYGCPSEKVICI